jgi:hypothetical protein
MKKIRVYTITGIALGIQGFGLLIHLILYNFFHIELLQLQIMGFSLILLGLSQFFGLTTSDDFKKNNNGYIIDDKETINWYLNHSFFLFCFVFQLIFAIDPMMGTRMIGGNFNYVLTSLLPTFIFILRSFVKKNTINERELIKLNRRDRIKTSDLNELNNKVDLSKWISNDYVLQVDKELFSKLVLVNVKLLQFADSSLRKDKEFLLRLISINSKVTNEIDMYQFDEFDFDHELFINIINQYRKKHPQLVDVVVDFELFVLTQNIPIDIIISKIIYIKQYKVKDFIRVWPWYNLLRDELVANSMRMSKYKKCEKDLHMMLKTDSTCCYCE